MVKQLTLNPATRRKLVRAASSQVFIDDFEGSRNAIDLRFPLVSWGLASTPAGNGAVPRSR